MAGWKSAAKVVFGTKDVGLGSDLATAHGHTRWLGVTSVGSLLAARHAKIPRLILDRSHVEEVARVPPSDHALGETRSRREERVALARGTQ